MADRKEGKPRARTRGKGAKRTLSISAETDTRLDVLARFRGITRSELAERILSAGLAQVVVMIDGRPIAGSEAAA
jgi:hypothetical protein